MPVCMLGKSNERDTLILIAQHVNMSKCICTIINFV